MKLSQFRHINRIRDYEKEKIIFSKRLIGSIIGMLILVCILFVNLYHLQVIKYDNYQTRSNDNRIKIVPLSPPRGIIYDRNHYVLADNRPLFSLVIIPELATKIVALNSKDKHEFFKNVINDVNEFLELNLDSEDIEQISERIRVKRNFVSTLITDNLNEEQVAKFSVEQYRYPGVRIEANLKRYYPLGDTLTHAIGYVARIGAKELEQIEQEGKADNYAATNDIGKQGIEKYYENILHGVSGQKQVEVDSKGRIIRTLNQTPPIPGRDITLSIDIRLQVRAQELLRGKRGALIAMNPKTGEILAFVSSPSYDPNPFVRGIKSKEYNALINNPDKPLINRVTQGSYSPASTIKPLMLIMGLNEDLISPHTKFFGAPYFQLPGSTHKFRDWRRWGHGWMDIYRAVEISADTFFYDLAYKAGIDKINLYMTKFGMGQKTGVDIHEETAALMPSKQWKKKRYKHDWVPGDTVSIGIGQGYWTTTLLQLARAHSILLNKGVDVIPHILNSSKDPTGTYPDKRVKPPLNHVLNLKNEEFWEYAKEGMCRVINGPEGTGRRAFMNTTYTACGKSGTAQVVSIKQDAKYNAKSLKETQRDNALFVSFAPKDDPEILVAVIAENIGGGSTMAAPITRKILDDYFIYKYSRVPATNELISNTIEKIRTEHQEQRDAQKKETNEITNKKINNNEQKLKNKKVRG
jgi:penicillin-binding protein 2